MPAPLPNHGGVKKFLRGLGSYASQEKSLCIQEESAGCTESQQLLHAGWAKFRSIRLDRNFVPGRECCALIEIFGADLRQTLLVGRTPCQRPRNMSFMAANS